MAVGCVGTQTEVATAQQTRSVVSITNLNPVVAENDGNVTLQLRITSPVGPLPCSVKVFAFPGSARNTEDYLPLPSTGQIVTWQTGQGGETKSVPIHIVNDLRAEPTETFRVQVAPVLDGNNRIVGAAIPSSTAGQTNVTITDDDTPKPTISINSVTQREGDPGNPQQLSFKVTLAPGFPDTELSTKPGDYPVTVIFSTENVTAVARSDYKALLQKKLTWNVGDPGEQTVVVDILPDKLKEENETLNAVLSNPQKALLKNPLSPVGVGTILNDDQLPTVSIINNITVTEGSGGIFLIQLSAPYPENVTVDISGHGSARLIFTPGQTAKSFLVTTTDDAVFTGDSTFEVFLANAINATIYDGSGTCLIVENDPRPPAIAFPDSPSDGESE